jgi:hypothetical protein
MTGAVVGLVCITPAAGFVRPLSALVFGVLGSCSSFFAIKYLKRGIADTLDAFFCHGVAGTIGTVRARTARTHNATLSYSTHTHSRTRSHKIPHSLLTARTQKRARARQTHATNSRSTHTPHSHAARTRRTHTYTHTQVLVGFFSEAKANPAAPNGVFFDASGTGGRLLGEQTLAAFVTAVWSFAFTFVFLTICKFVPFVGLRPSEEHESIGLDESMHGQKAYELPSEEPAEELVAVIDVDSSVRKGTSPGSVRPPSPGDAGVVFAVPIATPTEEVVSC